MRFLSRSTTFLNQIARKIVQDNPLPQELTARILGLFWADDHACPSSLPFKDNLLRFIRQRRFNVDSFRVKLLFLSVFRKTKYVLLGNSLEVLVASDLIISSRWRAQILLRLDFFLLRS